MITDTDRKTISDYSQQWTQFTDNSGYYGSVALLQDLFGPLLLTEFVKDKEVCDIGSGTGRIVNMLLDAGARHVTAVEPSDAFKALQVNIQPRREKVILIHDIGEALPPEANQDLVVSFGVLDHIVNPLPTVKAAYHALKPGGKMLIWIYGYEGNQLYLLFFATLRRVTALMSSSMLFAVCKLLCVAAEGYGLACRMLPLPLRQYFLNQFMKLDHEKRQLTIYDQLKPAYAKYYRQDEARQLLSDAGFVNVRTYHRHGYSWTVSGEKASAVSP
jgi:SAM-dependent methyltransferase